MSRVGRHRPTCPNTADRTASLKAACAAALVVRRKLLKKVDFLQWKQDANIREIRVMRRYHIQQREDYQAYNRLCGSIRGLAHKLSQLPEQDPFRSKYEGMLLSKLYDMGILDVTVKVADIEGKVTVSALCRRRLAVVMCRLKMSETVSKVS